MTLVFCSETLLCYSVVYMYFSVKVQVSAFDRVKWMFLSYEENLISKTGKDWRSIIVIIDPHPW